MSMTPAAVRAAVDIVAEKDERRRTAVGMALAARDQVTQLLQRAVNIADGVDERRSLAAGPASGAE